MYPIEGLQGEETAVQLPNADEATTASDRKREKRRRHKREREGSVNSKENLLDQITSFKALEQDCRSWMETLELKTSRVCAHQSTVDDQGRRP